MLMLPGGVIKELSYRVDFNGNLDSRPLKDSRAELGDMFSEFLQRRMGNFQEGDLARLYVIQPQVSKLIIDTPQPIDEMNPELIMEAVESVLQNGENLEVTKGYKVQLGVARMECGGMCQLMPHHQCAVG